MQLFETHTGVDTRKSKSISHFFIWFPYFLSTLLHKKTTINGALKLHVGIKCQAPQFHLLATKIMCLWPDLLLYYFHIEGITPVIAKSNRVGPQCKKPSNLSQVTGMVKLGLVPGHASI